MLNEIMAHRHIRLMSSGRTKPSLIHCRLADGQPIDVVAKFSAGCSVGGLVREAISAMMARDLGLPAPEPFLIRTTDQYIATIDDPSIRDQIIASCGVGFGTRKLPAGFWTWSPSPDKMAAPLDRQALDIMAFDCWVTNADRRVSNPNLLSDGKNFAIIDHELALMTKSHLFWNPPWDRGALKNSQPPVNHALFNKIRSRASYNFDRLLHALMALSDEKISAYAECLPSEWNDQIEVISEICEFIRNLRENAAPAIQEVKRALA